MLIAVDVAGFVIRQVSTGVIVALLILLNVVLGSRQELKARESVDALAVCRCAGEGRREGDVALVPAIDVVPGDIVEVEAGDIVPADGRIIRSATLETQEAALTGESADLEERRRARERGRPARRPVEHVSRTRPSREGRRPTVVTATGMRTQMGRIATMLTSVTRTRSPLQKELASLTKVLGLIAWGAVAFIVVVGVARGESFDQVLLLGTAMAISAIPTGMPTFVRPALARRQAAGRRQGRGQEPDRRGDARSDERDQHGQDRDADDERDDGVGHLRERRLVHGRGRGLPQGRRDPRGRRGRRARLHAAGLWARPRQRRDRLRRRRRGGGSDGGGARRAGGQARRRRRRDQAHVPAPGRGAVRLRLQVHGHVSPRPGQRAGAGRPARQGRARRRPLALHARRRLAERLAGADRRRAGRHRRGQRPHGREGPAGARVRSPPGRRERARHDGRRSDVAHARSGLRRPGRDHRPTTGRGEGSGAGRARRRHRRAHDHRRPRRHRAGDRRDPRARAGGDQRQRARGALRRGAHPAATRAPRLRPRLAAGQAPPRPPRCRSRR